MKTNKKGISLIVLAITIIVMIILATAIVLSLTSNNMVDSAKEATAANNLANAKQLARVAEAEWEMEPVKGITFKQYLESKLIEAGFNVSGGVGSIEVDDDANLYVHPPIPAGFVASTYEGENKILTGLVIYQTPSLSGISKNVAQTTYNQYVWVPVQDITTFEREYWGSDGVHDTAFGISSYDTNDAKEAAEYMAMKASVEENGGFYIARYEAGLPEGKAPGTVTSTDKPVSKKNADVWNYISWTNMKAKCETLSSGTAVYHLMYGEEWDAAIKFISKTDPNYIKYHSEENAQHGNYTGNLLKTGSSDYYARNNIYDMAGNVWELTMEYESSTKRVKRGGGYSADANYWPAFSRQTVGISSENILNGFRMALYLK